MSTPLSISEEAKLVWLGRLSSVLAMMDFTLDRVQPAEISQQDPDSPVGELQNAMQRLRTFGEEHFSNIVNLFHKAALDAPTPSQLSNIRERRPGRQHVRSGVVQERPIPIAEFVLDLTLNRISTDLLILETAYNQRTTTGRSTIAERSLTARSRTDGGKVRYKPGDVPKDTRLLLAQADTLALGALATLDTKLFAVRNASVRTYIQPGASARVLPYAPLALVGIPVTSLYQTRDLLSIPHEVGHFLFWQSKSKKGRPFSHSVSGLAKHPLAPWVEEIFADIVGCLIGGPAAAASMQEMMMSYVDDAFVFDDGHHPIPALRPFIYIYLMKQRGLWGEVAEDMCSAAGDLDDRWRATLEKVIGRAPENFAFAFDGQAITLEQLHTPYLKQLINRLLGLLQPEARQRSWLGSSPNCFAWSTSGGENAQRLFEDGLPDLVHKLSEAVENYRKQQPVGAPSDGAPFPDPESLPKYNAIVEEQVFQGDSKWEESLRKPENWLRLVEFEGWTSAGPGGEKPHLG